MKLPTKLNSNTALRTRRAQSQTDISEITYVVGVLGAIGIAMVMDSVQSALSIRSARGLGRQIVSLALGTKIGGSSRAWTCSGLSTALLAVACQLITISLSQ